MEYANHVFRGAVAAKALCCRSLAAFDFWQGALHFGFEVRTKVGGWIDPEVPYLLAEPLRKVDGGMPSTRLKTTAIRSGSLNPQSSEMIEIG